MPDAIPAQPAAPAAITTPAPAGASGTAPAALPAGQSDALSAADIKAKNELKKEMQRVAEARAAFQKERDTFTQEREAARREEAMLAVDPDSYMKKRLGEKWYETLTKAKLGDDSNLAVQQLRQEWEAREKARAEAEAARATEDEQRTKEEKERADEEARVAIDEFRTEATAFVKEKPEDYQSIHALKLEASVAEKVQNHFKQTGKVLTHKEGADLLESELDKAVDAVLATKKWQERLGKREPAKPVGHPQLVVPRSAPTTIDNGMRAGAAPQAPQRPTKEQKYEKAMKRLAEWEAEKAKSQ